MAADASGSLVIERLDAESVRARADELADLLIDAVDGGAAVHFLKPVTPLAAVRWVLDVADGMRRQTHLFAAFEDGALVGSVQLIRASAPNQPHRADVAKLLVHRRSRGRGVATALMAELETTARVLGISLLTLDTAAGGEARRLYERLGFQHAGEIPGYVQDADGHLDAAVLFYKTLD